MKSFIIASILCLPTLAFAGIQKLSCESGNITIELHQASFGSLKYKYQDKKRNASAVLSSSSYTFGGSDEGDFVTLEMYPVANYTYTAVIEDYEEVLAAKIGRKGLPMLLMVEDENGSEKHLNVSCEVVR